MKTENTMTMVLAAAVGALCSYCAQLVVPLAVLVAVMLADYVTGMAKAWSTGALCSRTGVRGIVKKVGYRWWSARRAWPTGSSATGWPRRGSR